MIHRQSKKSVTRILAQNKTPVTKINTKKLRPHTSGFFLIF